MTAKEKRYVLSVMNAWEGLGYTVCEAKYGDETIICDPKPGMDPCNLPPKGVGLIIQVLG